MKAEFAAVLSVAIICGIAAPSFAQCATIQNVGTAPIVTGPAVIAGPACTSRQLIFSATYPGSVVQIVPMPKCANVYGDPSWDWSADYTWEAFGGESDLSPIGGGG
jgi:hypothetical protein